MSAKILIVEDDVTSAELIQFQLEQAGYEVSVAIDGAEGLRQAYSWQPDLILLDVMMPAMSGWTVCERLREITDIAIVFVTVLDQEKHVIQGFDLGADDYITKPFDNKELLARVEAILRRQKPRVPSSPEVLVYGDVQIDLDGRRIIRGDEAISLTPLESKLLACLAERPGTSITHDYLLRQVWGENQKSRSSLKLYIWYLRRKLERDPTHPEIIVTDHGVGYRLCQPQR